METAVKFQRDGFTRLLLMDGGATKDTR